MTRLPRTAPTSGPAPHGRRGRGLSLAELLVVLAIIAVLTAIAIPTVTSRVERARIASATADCRAYAQAEDACAAIHDFYVPLQVLDDLPGDTLLNDDADRIGLENNIFLIDPLVPADNQLGSQFGINDTNSRVTDLREQWMGPFIDFRRATNTPNPVTDADERLDFPLDPYGQPYRFFSAIGVIGSTAEQESIQFPENLNINFSNGVITTDLDLFDRYVVASTGRDTEWSQTGGPLTLEEGDDIFHYFGIVGYETGSLVRFPF